MSTNNVSSQNLIFYVEEHKDDFTFYVAKDDDNRVIERLNQKRQQKPGEPAGESFSFAEMVFVKTLKFTKDSLSISTDFLRTLDASAPDAQHKFLLTQLGANEKSKHLNGPLAELDAAGRKTVRDALIDILDEVVQGESLEQANWCRQPSEEAQEFLEILSDDEKKRKWSNRLSLEQTFPDLILSTQVGRGLICSSYVGEYLSVTFRKLTRGEGYVERDPKPVDRNEHLFSLNEYYDRLYEEVFVKIGSSQQAQGLLVVTGSTKSAKSEITRGLIHSYLQRKEKSKRSHHLVTFEDPVEKFFSEKTRPENGCAWLADEADEIDYTPRQKEKDAGLLEDALSDALRQTPALFFVGETRNKEEWKVLLNFAATGHLIVTTAHAGSLVEAMHKIFEAVDVTTAAERNEVASKLLAVIHLRSYDLSFNTGAKQGRTNALFPALWRRTPRGVAALTSDGLASLLPSRPKQDTPSCLGRRWLIQQIAEHDSTQEPLQANFDVGLKSLIQTAYAKAAEWDLRGE
ncbi:MAG TPA: ATPase, T2SS/T4P/T4SS family [Pyrinomonadaceae bacterium]|nr:ATPase, T2SS/T4P/T4SS family [Pyrinomonadaceae bacterium]